MRRSAIALAAATLFVTLAGCAIIVVPDDANGNVQFSSAFGGNVVQGNGQNTVERREIGDLDGIDINGALQVEVRVGPAPSLQVEGDSNLLPLLRTEARGGTLKVWTEGRLRTDNPLRVVLTTPRLQQVNANGSGRLAVSGLNGGALDMSLNGSRSVQLAGSVSRLDARLNGSGGLNASALDSGSTVARLNGSGQLDLGRVNGDTLSLMVHGSGGASARGNVRNLTVSLSGSGSADLAGLTSQSAELSTNGSGSISAAVSQSLVADANGSGRVTVYGNPPQRNISGKRVTVVQ
jgi:hypothetical protein